MVGSYLTYLNVFKHNLFTKFQAQIERRTLVKPTSQMMFRPSPNFNVHMAIVRISIAAAKADLYRSYAAVRSQAGFSRVDSIT